MSDPSRAVAPIDYQPDFDRKDPKALLDREVFCSAAYLLTHALDNHGALWWWSYDDEIWYLIDGEDGVDARREIDAFVAQMRRAVPVIRIFAESDFDGEKEPAYQTLAKFEVDPSCWTVWRLG